MAAFDRADPNIIEKLSKAATSTVAGLLLTKFNIRETFMVGVFPLNPGQRMIGQAFTLRYLPKRLDLDLGRPPREQPQHIAVEAIGPGEVMVVERRGNLQSATGGDAVAVQSEGPRGRGVGYRRGATRYASYQAAGPAGILRGCPRRSP